MKSFLPVFFGIICTLNAMNLHSQCPTVEFVMLNACGTEELNEFMIINSGGTGFFVEDIQLDFDSDNNVGGPQNNDINIGSSPCGLQPGNPNSILNCTNVIPAGPGTFIPPFSFIVLQTSGNADFAYNFFFACSIFQPCVFVIANSCVRTEEAFQTTNTGTQTTTLSISSLGCSYSFTHVQDPVVLGSDGTYFLPPTNSYTNVLCNIPFFENLGFTNQPAQLNPIPDVVICDGAGYTLPPITGTGLSGNQAYFTGSNGSGTSFNPGDVVTIPGTYYIFDPGAGCSDEVSFTVTFNTPTNIVIPPLAPACSGDPPFALPTTQSGFTGTWSGPGVNNNVFNPAGQSGTIPLTFTPNPGQCANPTTTTITVTLITTPVITGLPVLPCQSDPPVPLPTVLGAITGNWSGPGVVNNIFNPAGLSGIIPVVFTPDPGQCASLASTIIIVLTAVTPTLSGVPASVCSDAPPISLPTTQSGIIGNWSGPGVSGNTFDPTGLDGSITLTFTPNPGPCANSNTISITVNEAAPPNISGVPAALCANDAPVALPTLQSGITGAWSGPGVIGNSFNPSGLNGTISLTFTPAPGQCANPASATINVTPAATPIITGLPAVLCQLDPAIPLPTTLSGLSGNWSGPGVNTNNFNPSGLSGNITLSFTPSPGQCANSASTQILVNPASPPTLSGVPGSFCSADPPFVLPTTQSGISGNWSGPGVSGNTFNPAGLNGSVTLTFTPSPGQCANANSLTVSVTTITPPTISGVPASICQNEPPLALNPVQSGIIGNWSGPGVSNNIFNPSGLLGNIALTFDPNPGQCALPATASITVIQDVTPVISGLPGSVCALDPPLGLSNVQSGIQGSWSGPGVSGNTFNPSGLGGDITITFTPNPGQCANAVSAVINVQQAPSPAISGLPTSICESDPPVGLPVVQSGIPGVWSGAGVSGNIFNPNGLNGSITLTFSPNAGICASPAFASITVTQAVTPPLSGIPLSVCQTDPALPLPTTQSGISGTWSGTGVFNNNFSPAGLSGPNTLTFTPNPGQCAFPNDLTVSVNAPVAPAISGVPSSICANANPISLPTLQSGITGVWTGPGVSGNLFNPNGLSGVISLTFAPLAGQCAIPVVFQMQINTSPTFVNLSETCDLATQTYTVSFDIIGGLPGTYTVNGLPVGGNSFVSDPIQSNVPYSFNLSDANACTPFVVAGVRSCDCPTFAGTMNFSVSPVLVCPGEGFSVVHNSNETLEPGDVLMFVLHTNAGSSLGTVLVSSSDTNFPPPPGVVLSTTYYVSPVAGNDDGSGLVDLNDPCLSVTQGVPVVFLEEASGALQLSLCPGESIEVNGTTYNEGNPSGAEFFPGASSNGCDSTVVIELSFFPPAQSSIEQTLCPGASLSVGNELFDEANPSGTVLLPGASSNGCDSTVTVSLSFFPIASGNLTQTLCPGESLDINGSIYGESNPSGTEIFPGASVNGCDSILLIELSFFPEASGALSQTICPGESILINGTVYDEANPSGTELFPGGSVNGCDSTLAVNLDFFPPAVESINQTLCLGASLLINGTTYDENNPSGAEFFPGGSSNGCDSTVTISLSFFPIASGNLTQTLCPGESLNINGSIYSESNPSGTEFFPGGSSNGCDSTVTINLSFFPEATAFLDTLLATGGSIVIQGTTYDANNPGGVEVFSGASANGCDSTLFISLRFETAFEAFFETLSPACPGEANGSISITSIEGGLSPYTVFINGVQAEITDVLPIALEGLAAGTYNLLILDAAGTERSWTLFLENPQPLLVLLPEEIRLPLGDDVLLQAQATVPVALWQWSPPTYLSCIDCPNPTVLRPNENIRYTATATDENGCTGFAQVQLLIERPRNVYIPNVFSPNNDGANDEFGIFAGRDVALVHSFRVFSRWGELLHEALNFIPDPNDSRAGSWDGRFRGQAMNPGVYVWYVELEFIDGRREIRSGDVTLVR